MATQVAQLPPLVRAQQLRVTARDLQVLEHQVAIRVAPDPHPCCDQPVHAGQPSELRHRLRRRPGRDLPQLVQRLDLDRVAHRVAQAQADGVSGGNHQPAGLLAVLQVGAVRAAGVAEDPAVR